MGKKLGNCRKCMRPTRAVTVERITLGAGTYDIALCDPCADKFQSDMFRWTRCGVLVDEDRTVREDDLGPMGTSYVHIPVIKVHDPVVHDPVQIAQVPMPRPRFVTDGLPAGHERWVFTEHAEERQVQRDVTREEALWAALRPDVRRPGREPGTRIHVRGTVHVVVDMKRRLIITAARNNPTHPKQEERPYASAQ